MSDFNPGKGWEEIDFFDVRKDDEILVLTRSTTDAPDGPIPGHEPVLRITFDGEDTFFRRVDSGLRDYAPGTIVHIKWNSVNHWVYRVTEKGNFREVKTGIKIKKENYPYIEKVTVVYDPKEGSDE